jgi:hypothetical protein
MSTIKISWETPCLKGAGTVATAPVDQARHLLGYQAQLPATRLHSSSLSTQCKMSKRGLWDIGLVPWSATERCYRKAVLLQKDGAATRVSGPYSFDTDPDPQHFRLNTDPDDD